MNDKDRQALIAIPICLFIAAGLAWAGSQGGAEVSGISLFALGVGLAFLIQWIAFIPAYVYQTERFFDLTGSVTFMTVILTGLLLSPSMSSRTLLLGLLVVIWALRLGAFLYGRIRAEGEDRRFRELKPSWPRFLLTWTLQGLWVSFSLGAALAAITSLNSSNLGSLGEVGLLVWLLGFGIEVVADWQKSKFKADTSNKEKFINEGLWSWSRHPNYFGELVLWIGIAILAFPILQGWQLITLVSPVFVFLLLTRISGIPMLEQKADENWGGQNDYEAYKANTSILIPLPPSKN